MFVAYQKVPCNRSRVNVVHVGVKALTSARYLLQYANTDMQDVVVMEVFLGIKDEFSVIYDNGKTQYKMSGVDAGNIDAYNEPLALLLESVSLKRIYSTYHVLYHCIKDNKVVYKFVPEKKDAGLVVDTIGFDMCGNIYLFDDNDEPVIVDSEATQMYYGCNQYDIEMTPQGVLDCCNGNVIDSFLKKIRERNPRNDMANVSLYKIL